MVLSHKTKGESHDELNIKPRTGDPIIGSVLFIIAVVLSVIYITWF